jgi:hypothetical protein
MISSGCTARAGFPKHMAPTSDSTIMRIDFISAFYLASTVAAWHLVA